MMGSKQPLDKGYNFSMDNWYNSASLPMCLDTETEKEDSEVQL